MPIIKARRILKPEEGTRTVLVKKEGLNEPFLRENGPNTYICGFCGTILVQNIFPGQARNLVFECPKCQSHNEIP